jgi:hypothetical protein
MIFFVPLTVLLDNKLGNKKKRLTVTQYSGINGINKLMMFTNNNKMIYAVVTECYKAVIRWYQQINCSPC